MPACVLLTLLLLSGRSPVATATDSLRVRWFSDAGAPAWQLSPAAAAGVDWSGHAEPLSAPVWLRPVPDHELALLEGGSLRLSSMRDRVVVLDFWATWCAPCLDELPHLQQMQRELGEHGVDVIAVNAGEPDEQVRAFADQIGLELPVARYDAGLDRIFHVGRLPTVVIVDQQGRVRARWNGYTPGQERSVAARVRDLLDNASAPATTEVGSVLLGGGRLTTEWVKKGLAEIRGLAVAVDTGGAPRLVVARTGELAVLDATGEQLLEASAPPGTGLVRAGRERGGNVVGYRVGGTVVVVFDPADGTSTSIRVPAPVMDIAFVASEQGEQVWLATVAGVLRLAEDSVLRPVQGPGAALAVAAVAAGGAVVLSTEAVVARFAADGEQASQPLDLPGAWSIVTAGEDGWGALPREVLHSAVGAFVGDGRQLAMALPQDRLLVADLNTGVPLYAARLPGLGPLAAVDLDGDGDDELVAGVGRRLVVWTRADDP